MLEEKKEKERILLEEKKEKERQLLKEKAAEKRVKIAPYVSQKFEVLVGVSVCRLFVSVFLSIYVFLSVFVFLPKCF